MLLGSIALLDDLRARLHAAGGSSRAPAMGRSSSGRSGAAWRAWSPRACSRSRCSGDGTARLPRSRRRCSARVGGAPMIRSTPSRRPPPGSSRASSSASWGSRGLAIAPSACPTGRRRLAVLLSFILALVACRVTGETDTTPVGAMGKITQLVFGVLHPRQRQREPDERQRDGGGGEHSGRSAHGSEERLSPRRESPQAVPRPVRRDLRRHDRHRAVVSASRARRGCARDGPVPRPRRANVAGRRRRAVATALAPLAPSRRGRSSSAGSSASSFALAPDVAGASYSSRPPPVSAWRGPSTGTTACCSSSAAPWPGGWSGAIRDGRKNSPSRWPQAGSPARASWA